MKHMPNTLYVTQPECHLTKDGETVLVKKGDEKLLQLPIHTIGQIVCFGFTIYISPPLMAFCAENGVSIAWLSESGKFLGRVEGPVKGNVLLRRAQYRWADDPARARSVAKCIVAAKINNSRMNLQRFLRNQGDDARKDELQVQVDKLARLLHTIESCDTMDKLRGIEGEAASAYFSVFDHLILQQKEAFRFSGRNRRPPLDSINAMLSFVYTLLTLDIRSSLETVGLDPYVGFLHVDRPGRPGLALDLVEEFRAPLADRLVLSLVNLKQVQADGFVTEGSEVKMTAECRKTLISAYQNRKKETIQHPFLDEKMEIGLVLQTQSRLLARHIRGDIDLYPAMIWK
ncbi:type I-C CRISPR-associated endonuclease Cas1 [candidate division KSB1 bacterium]|nr:type I-C CRISPR-associated endonuclease Cas1 [candidate division KSB1 bacterium]